MVTIQRITHKITKSSDTPANGAQIEPAIMALDFLDSRNMEKIDSTKVQLRH
jgi:hypothetical protein